MEIFVVDNASVDQSVAMVHEKFPFVHVIANKKNVGFSTANNQAIKLANGKYVLLLNPDTVVQEDTFLKCLDFMENHPDAGGLGVKMIDGKGNFLPESKRALPTPQVAFYKTFGLSTLFPKSKLFGKYHLGYLNKDKNHKVEVLSGAFIMMPKEVVDKIEGLDEDFFMYGEDIDLSYRITKAGYQNYYLADTEIIHYKGESTKKGSLNYVKVFYEAMLIFARKHFSKQQARVYSVAIYLAIFIKGLFTVISNFAKKISLPLFDAVLAYGGLYVIAELWAEKIKISVAHYPNEFTFGVIPAYVIAWMISGYAVGAYDKPYKVKNILKAVGWGTIVIAAIYGFLPEELRFSRAIILLGGIWTGMAMLTVRLIYHTIVYNTFRFELDSNKNIVIVGNGSEAERALTLLTQTAHQANFIGFVSYQSELEKENVIGSYAHLKTIVDLYSVHEIIFCAEQVPTSEVIQQMTSIGASYSYKILPSKSSSIIGSNSKNTAGDLYAIDVHLNLNNQRAKQSKRLFDVLSSITLLTLIPCLIWFVREKLAFVKNCINVLLGKKTWVGYLPSLDNGQYQLPKLKKGVLYPIQNNENLVQGISTSRLNLLYAKDYSIELDVQYLLRNFALLGSNK